MKKVISFVITFILVMSFGSFSFAAEENTEKSKADIENAFSATYGKEETEIKEEASIIDEVIPKASALPKTGGIPAEAFYVAGILLVVAALIISRKKTKPVSKN